MGSAILDPIFQDPGATEEGKAREKSLILWPRIVKKTNPFLFPFESLSNPFSVKHRETTEKGFERDFFSGAFVEIFHKKTGQKAPEKKSLPIPFGVIAQL